MNKIMDFTSGTPKVDLNPLPEYEISLSAPLHSPFDLPLYFVVNCICNRQGDIEFTSCRVCWVSFTSHHLAQGPGSSVWTAGIVEGIIFKWATTSEIWERHYFNLLPQKTTDSIHYFWRSLKYNRKRQLIYLWLHSETATLTNDKLITQVKLTPCAWGGTDKCGLFQGAHFKQFSLCTPLQPNSTINTQQKWAARCQGSAVWTSVPLEFAVNFLDLFELTELRSFTALEHFFFLNITGLEMIRAWEHFTQTEKKKKHCLHFG